MSRYQFLCQQCGREFFASRRDAKRCSSSCRVYAFRSIPPTLGIGGCSDDPSDNVQRRWTNGPTGTTTGVTDRSATTYKQGRTHFVEASSAETLAMSMEEARDYCARLDAARGKTNGAIVEAAVVTEPILREPQRPPDGSPMQALNEYYAAKKRWNEQRQCKA